MRARRLGAVRLAPLALAAVLTGCGASSARQVPDLARLPLVRGAAIVAAVRQCDRGSGPFCAVELVVVARRYRTSDALLASERRRLRKLGWTGTGGDTGDEQAADSPGHKLRLTYATAYGDLKGIDLGWIQRSRRITLALSHVLFNRSAAMSLMLELGAS